MVKNLYLALIVLVGTLGAHVAYADFVEEGELNSVRGKRLVVGLESFNQTPESNSAVNACVANELSLTQRAILVGTGVAKIAPLAAMCGTVAYLGWYAAIELPRFLLSPDAVGASMAYLARINPLQVAPLTADLVRGAPCSRVNVHALAAIEFTKENAHWVALGASFFRDTARAVRAATNFATSSAVSGFSDIYYGLFR